MVLPLNNRFAICLSQSCFHLVRFPHFIFGTFTFVCTLVGQHVDGGTTPLSSVLRQWSSLRYKPVESNLMYSVRTLSVAEIDEDVSSFLTMVSLFPNLSRLSLSFHSIQSVRFPMSCCNQVEFLSISGASLQEIDILSDSLNSLTSFPSISCDHLERVNVGPRSLKSVISVCVEGVPTLQSLRFERGSCIGCESLELAHLPSLASVVIGEGAFSSVSPSIYYRTPLQIITT